MGSLGLVLATSVSPLTSGSPRAATKRQVYSFLMKMLVFHQCFPSNKLKINNEISYLLSQSLKYMLIDNFQYLLLQCCTGSSVSLL